MSNDSKPKSLTDDFEKLFDLIKEGASYLLHIFLYFMSKTFPLEFIENLFDHHKKSSSYDYSKEGKTYIYRLFNALFAVEKHFVAIALQYAYSYLPLPFIKAIYENFCVNNNLECTDVKLKKCKKALINSSKDSKREEKKPKGRNDLVSRPHPFIPNNPNAEIETVSSRKSENSSSILTNSPSPNFSPTFSSGIRDLAPMSSTFGKSSRNQSPSNKPFFEETAQKTFNKSSSSLKDKFHLEKKLGVETTTPIISTTVPVNIGTDSWNMTRLNAKSLPSKIPTITLLEPNTTGPASLESLENPSISRAKQSESLPAASTTKIEVEIQPLPVSLDSTDQASKITVIKVEVENNPPQNAENDVKISESSPLPEMVTNVVSKIENEPKILNVTSSPALESSVSQSASIFPSLNPPLMNPINESSKKDSSASKMKPLQPLKTLAENELTRSLPSSENWFNNLLQPNTSEKEDNPSLSLVDSTNPSASSNKITPTHRTSSNFALPPGSSEVMPPVEKKQENFFANLLSTKTSNEKPAVGTTLETNSPPVKLEEEFPKQDSFESTMNSSANEHHAKLDPIGNFEKTPSESSRKGKNILTNLFSPDEKSSQQKFEMPSLFDKKQEKTPKQDASESTASSSQAPILSSQIPLVEEKTPAPKPLGDFTNIFSPSSNINKVENFFTNLFSSNKVDSVKPEHESPVQDLAKLPTNVSQASAPSPKSPSVVAKINNQDPLGNSAKTFTTPPTSIKQKDLFPNISTSSMSAERTSLDPKLEKFVPEKTDETPMIQKPDKPSIPSNLNKKTLDSDPFADLVKILNSPTTKTENDSVTNLFEQKILPVEDSTSNKMPSSSFSFPSALQSFPTSSHPTLAAISETEKKSGESVAPVSKNIPPTVDLGSSLEQQFQQNNKALQKNIDDFGKSIANVFSGGLNAPTPSSSSNI